MRRRYVGCSAENRPIFESSSMAFSGGIDVCAMGPDGVSRDADGVPAGLASRTPSPSPSPQWRSASLMTPPLCPARPSMREESLGVDRGHAARACRRDGLAVYVIGDVAARENARDLRGRRAWLDEQIARRVHVELALEELRVR